MTIAHAFTVALPPGLTVSSMTSVIYEEQDGRPEGTISHHEVNTAQVSVSMLSFDDEFGQACALHWIQLSEFYEPRELFIVTRAIEANSAAP